MSMVNRSAKVCRWGVRPGGKEHARHAVLARIGALGLALLASSGCAREATIRFDRPAPPISVRKPNLNGLVVHDGYLLVIKKNDGRLFRVPLADPTRFSRVKVASRFVGGDGVTWLGNNQLLIIANQTTSSASNAVYALSSNDDWLTAEVRASAALGNVYPTTAAARSRDLRRLQPAQRAHPSNPRPKIPPPSGGNHFAAR